MVLLVLLDCYLHIYLCHCCILELKKISASFKFTGEDRRIKIWDLTQGTLMKDLRGHGDTVYALAFNRDNTTLASGKVTF